jgi:uncharacterized protein (TIGR02145 family)
MGQTNSNGGMPLGGNTSSEKLPLEIKRNALFNLEEIKVRWKKAALENCQGVPCSTLSVPGDVRDVVVTDGLEEGEVIVTFSPPLSDGGSPIIEYEVEVTEEVPAVNSPTISSYSPKNILIENITITSNDIPLTMAEDTNEPVSGFVVSSIIKTKGLKSPITVKGLKTSVSYIFKVFAKNLIGSSPPPSSGKTKKFTPKVFPCAAGPASSSPSLIINTPLTNITHNTTKATGIGTATDLPAGVTAAWSANVITISGTPTATGTFNYTIPLTGGCGIVNATGTITVNPVCPTATITYNSYTYNTVGIGNQCWMKENLRTRLYNDNTEIRFDNSGGTEGSTSQTWAGTGLNYGAYTIYANDSTATTGNLAIYGYLYNWYAVAGIITPSGTPTKNICPLGWHVPTDSDWNKLVIFIDSGADPSSTGVQSTTAGTKLKKNDALWTTNTGTDDYGFSVLPGGFRENNGSFKNISYNPFFWSATEYNNFAWYRFLYYNDDAVYREVNFKSVGASVRCLLSND